MRQRPLAHYLDAESPFAGPGSAKAIKVALAPEPVAITTNCLPARVLYVMGTE
jgi:hypothetical protein